MQWPLPPPPPPPEPPPPEPPLPDFSTVTVIFFVTVPALRVIVALPSANAVIFPFLSTRATDELLLLNVSLSVVSSGVILYVISLTSPTFKVSVVLLVTSIFVALISFGDTVTLAVILIPLTVSKVTSLVPSLRAFILPSFTVTTDVSLLDHILYLAISASCGKYEYVTSFSSSTLILITFVLKVTLDGSTASPL